MICEACNGAGRNRGGYLCEICDGAGALDWRSPDFTDPDTEIAALVDAKLATARRHRHDGSHRRTPSPGAGSAQRGDGKLRRSHG